MPYAVFAVRKNSLSNPNRLCDPLDFGRGEEPRPEILLRRGRVGLFESKDAAEEALRETGKVLKGEDCLKTFAYVILECVPR